MNHLKQFQFFDFERFSEKKAFLVTGRRVWKDKDTGATLGTCVDTVIIKDETPYEQKDGEYKTNRFKELTFKVRKNISIPENTYVKPINAVATIWGDYRNQLSVKCDDIQILQQAKK